MFNPKDLPPFPVLMDLADQWKWPAVPFEWSHEAAAEDHTGSPCIIETVSGAIVEGLLVDVDPAACMLSFRNLNGATLSLPFARFRSLTLMTLLRGAPPLGGGIAERLPLAAHRREYRLRRPDGQVVSGRTVGYVEAPEGLYFFTPVDEERLLQRVFVPRSAYATCEVGPTARDLAAEHWVSTPQELLAALERQRRMPVLRIGQSLLDLGLLTPEQLRRALAQTSDDAPLGERLVSSGFISRADLDTAIAHKMGYPLVDLTRFPIDLEAARKLPLHSAIRHRALPIMIDGQRMIVAVDKPSRLVPLETNYAVTPFTLVVVLASKAQILLALSHLSATELWAEDVSTRAQFYPSTR